MKVRWLGWAGVEIEADGAAVVIDPLADPGATFAALGDERGEGRASAVVARPRRRAPRSPGWSATCTAITPTPAALADALADDATVHEPAWPGGSDFENLGAGTGERGARARRA